MREPSVFGQCPVELQAVRPRGSLTLEDMRRNLRAAQAKWHGQCVACGNRNDTGLCLKFAVREQGHVEASFACDAVFAGFPGCLHGGVVAMLLDAAMTTCMFAHGFVGLTGELKVRYYHPVRIGKVARVSAWLKRSAHRLHKIGSDLKQDGVIKATASSGFLETVPPAAE